MKAGATRDPAPGKSHSRIQSIKAWLPASIWAACIFAGSTDVLAASRTSRFLVPFLISIFPSISSEQLTFIQLLLRKTGHLTEYAILAVLIMRGLRLGSGFSIHGRGFWIALGLAALYAASDEFHQSFVPSRTGSGMDVLIDTVGAAAGLCVARIFQRKPEH